MDRFTLFPRRLAGAALTLLPAAWLAFAPLGAAAAPSVPNFNLIDLRGANHELRRAEGRVVVLFFTGAGCPIAAKSIPKLKELRDQFGSKGVTFWIINSYSEDTTKAAIKDAEKLGLRWITYLRDPRQAVALALGVERTAEVVAINTSDWQIVYQGAIDDQYAEGAERPKAQNSFLASALKEFLAGQPVVLARTPAHGCRLAFAPTGESGSAPSYVKEVAPILQRRCVECHREGGIGPWEMDAYARVKNKSRMIEEVLLTRRMPPWDPNPDHGHFSGGNSLSREESQTLLQWVKAGAPRGEGADPLTEPLSPLPEWSQGKPDLVLRLPQPEQVPATGVLEYRNISLPNPLTNEVWLAGMEIKPGNRRVVHHGILYAKWPGSPDNGDGKGMFVAGWAPGTPPGRYPDGVGKRLPAKAEFTIEMHYTTCGTEQTDQTEVALYFWPAPQIRAVETRQAIELDVDIPPQTDNARHQATYAFKKPATLYSLAPHMHVRGKAMRYELLLPNGKKETLLDVPRYDFKWQYTYRFAEPRHVPAGSWLLVTGAFDNSPANPGNPDPKARVHFGLQSWDEMFIGFFEAADDPPTRASGTTLPKPSASAGSGGGQP